MKQLEELEKKVLAVLATNKALKEEVSRAQKENEALAAKVTSLEASLLTESSAHTELSDERQSICSSIDELLENIDSLQVKEGSGS